MSDKKSVSRRGIFRAAGRASVAASLLAPFRATGGVAWAYGLPKTYQKLIVVKPADSNKELSLGHFKLVEEPMPEVPDGKALVRVRCMNLHSAIRERMSSKGFVKPGNTDYTNYTIADVIASKDPSFETGTTIHCLAGWQTYQIVS